MSRTRSPLEAVWTTHLTPPAPSKQGLTVARIVAAAIAIADADGLAAVSMSRVAAELGFTTMSLYRHVASKDDLVLHMQDAAMGPPPPEGFGDGSWRTGLAGWALAVWGGLRGHPWVLQTIAMFGPPATPNQVAWLEAALRVMEGLPLSEAEKVSIMLLIDGHVLSDLLFLAAGTPSVAGTPDPRDFGSVLTGVLDPARYPALLRAIEGGAFDDGGPEDTGEADFRFRLERLLDGVEQLVEQRAARA